MKQLQFLSQKPEDTLSLARQLSVQLKAGDVISLKGDLGSGKTLFTQGIARGLQVTAPVTSPSFTLVQEYEGNLPIAHFDFYRLNSVSDIEDLGFDTYLEREGIVIIEWAEKGESLLPDAHIDILFERLIENGKIVEGQRVITVEFPANRAVKLIL